MLDGEDVRNKSISSINFKLLLMVLILADIALRGYNIVK